MTVAQLKVALTELNLDTRGTKAVLAARLGQAEGWLKHAAAKAGGAAAGGSSQAGTTPSGALTWMPNESHDFSYVATIHLALPQPGPAA